MSKMPFVEQGVRAALSHFVAVWPQSSMRGICPGRCPLRHGPNYRRTRYRVNLSPLIKLNFFMGIDFWI
jgi:hypothetical protein